jgi:2-polyprenyl-3-methyl-5-hydroxy-6-metoxy-1,4-benzoquinol methylase
LAPRLADVGDIVYPVELPEGSDQDIATWDRIAAEYSATAGRAGTIKSRFAGFVAETVGNPAGLDILDLGCGAGWLAEGMSRLGANVQAVDGSGALLTIAV